MKINFLLLFIFTLIISSCKKEIITNDHNANDVASVLASYGYKLTENSSVDIKDVPSITLDEFKKIMTNEGNVPFKNDFKQIILETVVKNNNTVVNDFIDNGTSNEVPSPGYRIVTFIFAALGRAQMPNTYVGTYSGGTLHGTLSYAGFNAGARWSYNETLASGFNNQCTNVGSLNKYFNIGGLSYERNFTVQMTSNFPSEATSSARIIITEVNPL